MRRLVAFSLAISLLGCTPSAQEKKYPVLPVELADCKFYTISDGYIPIKVVRCPNSTITTNYSQGKTTATTVVIDGVEYTKKD